MNFNNFSRFYSLTILKPGGKVISISGPPTKAFAVELNLSWFMRFVTGLLSRSILGKAKKLNVDYSFLFMKSNGKQLAELTRLIEAGIILPVMDQVFPLEKINEAMAYVQSGRAKGKVVVRVKS